MAQTAPRFSTRRIPASTAGAGPTEATRSLPTYLPSQRWDMGPTKSAITEQILGDCCLLGYFGPFLAGKIRILPLRISGI
ncbi:hypothetical protein OPV22_003281 [Ensete ventricosum]|uniref:Chlorophyll a-b binding protein, chloroplastic n=1 Tax=Ensete ventricosum TaxID=4639 RepID=A0AAV8S050_ENSVE|nr:hypothetical protein OPV22_003281 [Ensete ventricosum]